MYMCMYILRYVIDVCDVNICLHMYIYIYTYVKDQTVRAGPFRSVR